jgi:hypothetical protein
MTRKLIELVDAQPLPNLISIRALRPDEVLFVDSRATQQVTKRLRGVLKKEIRVHTLTIPDRYNPVGIYQRMERKISDLGWGKQKMIFNISGGNRPEAFAAYELAEFYAGVLAYMEWMKRQWYVRLYRFEGDRVELKSNVKLPGVFTLADYLNIHLPGFKEEGASRDERGRIDEGGEFEAFLYRTLEPHVDEIMAGVRPAGVAQQIEIDLVIRRGNAVGIIEAKTGVKKAGIDQLDTAGNQTYMGRYINKFLITGRRLPSAHKTLARAQQIHVIELPGYDYRGRLPASERQYLVQSITQALCHS